MCSSNSDTIEVTAMISTYIFQLHVTVHVLTIVTDNT